ncbi:hypothetical protein AB0H34_05220 [Saccharopolyspora shandongensis]
MLSGSCGKDASGRPKVNDGSTITSSTVVGEIVKGNCGGGVAP